MKIKESVNGLTKEKTYTIFIRPEDDVNEFDIAQSFSKQYPKIKGVIAFSRIVQIECGIIIVGLNLTRF